MNQYTWGLDPNWGCSDARPDVFTLQDHKDMQALDIRGSYLDGRITIGEFTELMQATDVPYVVDDMTGLVELTIDGVAS